MSRRSVLVLGRVASGRSEFAELLAGALPGSSPGRADPGGLLRRVGPPAAGADLARLAGLLAEAKPDEAVLVENLADWLPDRPGTDAPAELAAAIRDCPAARLVLVSSEAATSHRKAEALGSANQAVAGAVDAVVLVVASQPLWLKGTGRGIGAARATTAPDPTGQATDLSQLAGMPAPDDGARTAAQARLAGRGLGALAEVVAFAAACQGRPDPVPWQRVRVLVLHGDHAGAAGAAAPGSAAQVAALRDGTSPVAWLAGDAGAELQVVPVAAAAPIEDGPAALEESIAEALGHGWELAERAADEGVDAIVVGSVGDGAETAAAAVVAALAPSTEPVTVLGRVRTADGKYDDQAWIRRCAAVRDAVHRVRSGNRTAPRTVLAELAGPDIATATGLLLGAAARRTPVLLDGPVGAAAALAARAIAAPSRHWLLVPDPSGHPAVVRASEVLGASPLLDLRLDLGEGGTVLAALPLLRAALTLAAGLPDPASADTPGPVPPPTRSPTVEQ